LAAKPYIVALEEHYHDPQVTAVIQLEGRKNPELAKRLDDLGELRLKEMDEAGVDYQILSLGAPATQRLPADSALQTARSVNDRLAEAVRTHPKRFGAFAALPTTTDAKLAADELERCVTKLGFVGAMIHGLSNGVFPDDKRFWPIFERAQALDVPLYFHPAMPHPAVIEAYLKDYAGKHPSLVNAGRGFIIETATLGIRLILSGVLEAYPKVKVILGHLGEGLRSSSGASIWRWRATASTVKASVKNSCATSMSPPAASFRTTRSTTASRRSVSTASCSRLIILSCSIRRARNGHSRS
jgi:2,3-dihydroxybenzoate decarboxylase